SLDPCRRGDGAVGYQNRIVVLSQGPGEVGGDALANLLLDAEIPLQVVFALEVGVQGAALQNAKFWIAIGRDFAATIAAIGIAVFVRIRPGNGLSGKEHRVEVVQYRRSDGGVVFSETAFDSCAVIAEHVPHDAN